MYVMRVTAYLRHTETSAIYKSDFHSLNYHFDGVREKNDEILDVALS